MPSFIRTLLTPKSTAKDTLRLECFFCGNHSNVPQTAIENVLFEAPNGATPFNLHSNLRRPLQHDTCISTGRKWTCTVCESVNVRDENGEIVDDIPEMRDPSLNRVVGAVKSRRTSQATSPTESVFCETCQLHQQLVAKMLAEFIPDESDPEYELYNASIDTYRRDLETRYPLVCFTCKIKVDEELSKKEKSLLMARLDHVLRRSRSAVQLPPGSRSNKEGVKPIIEPVPWWKQFGWATWGLIWVTTWVATIAIHIQGIITSPSYCDSTQPLLPTFPISGDVTLDDPVDHSPLHAIFAVMAELVYTTKHAATACLLAPNVSTTCTCALRNAWLPLLFCSLLSVWFNPTWRSRALRGSCKPVDGWHTYKKCHWQALVARLGIYLAITPTTSDVLAKTIHVALLAINLMNFYDALVALQVFNNNQLGDIRPDGLRITGKRTAGNGESSPKRSSPTLQHSPTPIWSEPPNTQRNMNTAHPHLPNDSASDLACLSLNSTGIRGHSTSSKRQGGMGWTSTSSTSTGPQNRYWNPFLSYRSTNSNAPVGSFGREPSFSHRPSPTFDSTGQSRSLADSRPQFSPFASSMIKETGNDHNDFVLGPQNFFPPEKPTGLEDLLTSFKIDDGSNLKRLQLGNNCIDGELKFARRIIMAATLIRIATVLQDTLQYVYMGFVVYTLVLLKRYALTRGSKSAQDTRQTVYVTNGLVCILCIRLLIIMYTIVTTYKTWQSALMTDTDNDNFESWNQVFWHFDMLQFPFFELSEFEIFVPWVGGDLASIAGLALDMAICWVGWRAGLQRSGDGSVRN